MGTDYGKVNSTKGRITYAGIDTDSWDLAAAEAAKADMEKNRVDTENWRADYTKVTGVYNTLAANSRYEELLGAMNDSFAKMAEAADKVEPASEPLKAAQEVYTSAKSETAKRQQLRSGLLSAFNRYGGGNGGVSASNTSSTALKSKADVLGG